MARFDKVSDKGRLKVILKRPNSRGGVPPIGQTAQRVKRAQIVRGTCAFGERFALIADAGREIPCP
jgi:hypothetical protein